MGARISTSDDQQRRDRGSCAMAAFLSVVVLAVAVWLVCALVAVIA